MPNDPDALMLRNKAALEQVNPIFDRINASWEKAEEFFRKQGILVPVDVCFDEDHQKEECYYIGLRKIGGKWRICAGEGSIHNPDPDFVNWAVITDTPVVQRSLLFKYLPRLMQALVASNESTVPRLQKSAEDAESILQSMGIE